MSKEAETTVLTIADFASALGVEPATARGRLRKAGVEREGGKWEWSSKTKMNKALSEVKAAEKAEATEEE